MLTTLEAIWPIRILQVPRPTRDSDTDSNAHANSLTPRNYMEKSPPEINATPTSLDQKKRVVENKRRKREEKVLTTTLQILNLNFRDRSGIIFSSFTEVLLMLFRAVGSSVGRTGLVCSSTPDCSLVRERSEPCYRRAVFIGEDLAVQGSPC